MIMKSSFAYLGAASAALLMTTAATQALDFKPYVAVDSGVNLLQDLHLKAIPDVGLDSGKFSFSPGYRVGVHMGVQVQDQVAIEFAPGLAWNSLHQTVVNDTVVPGIKGEFRQIPLMVNGIYSIPLEGKLKPFVGLGAGAILSRLELNAGGDKSAEDDVTFGYQGMAGISYAATERLSVSLGYQFMSSLDHKKFSTPTGAAVNHSVILGLGYKF